MTGCLITALLLPVIAITPCLFTQVCDRPVKLLMPLLEKLTAPFPLCQLLPTCNSSTRQKPDASEFFFDPQALEMARAIEAEDTAAIKALVKRLDINARHHRGMTFLMWSLAQLKYTSFKMLLALGADYNMEVEKKPVYGLAMQAQKTPDSPVVDPRWIKALVEAGWDPNQRTEEGAPLWWDARFPHKSLVLDYLIEHGNLDINAKDIAGNTATMMLASHEQYRQILKLLELGAELNPEKNNHVSFAYKVQTHPVPPDNPEYPYREKILQMLKGSGVKSPVPNPQEERRQLRKQQAGEE
ncbi:TPA: hypothetical protein EYP38_03775 [Candidatus Micrarchaeota archaeon]|nr:hypothetical protein [Candidatus Micrarchaeota archaeon]